MKRPLQLSIVILTGVLFLFSSCKKDNNNNPTGSGSTGPDTNTVWKQVHALNSVGVDCHYILDNKTAYILQPTNTTAQLLVTEDGGNTWTQHDVGVSITSANAVWFSSKMEGFVSFLSEGTHKTTDGGKTWRQISNRSGALFEKNGTLSIFASGGHHGYLFQYTNSTDTTVEISDSIGGNLIFPLPIRRYGNKIILPSQKGILRSDDNGDTWVWHETPFPVIYSMTMRSSTNWFVTGNAIGLYESLDDGKTWITHSETRGIPHAMDFHKDTLFSSASGNMHWSKDGLNFTEISETSRIAGHVFSLGDQLVLYNKNGVFVRRTEVK